jgi:formyltetrahydrofolate-dependent phosphoribosylglycinamide formyltransferase
VLVSGRGSNLQALLNASDAPDYPAQVVLVCANRDAPALEHARRTAVPHIVFRRADFASREARDTAMADRLTAAGVDLIVCAGYDAILSAAFVDRFAGQIINTHPSLLPQFAGCMDAPARALAAGVPETGCTVHLVTNEIDAGPILAQRTVPVRSTDTAESLHERIRAAEHQLLPEVVRQLAEQRSPLPLGEG